MQQSFPKIFRILVIPIIVLITLVTIALSINKENRLAQLANQRPQSYPLSSPVLPTTAPKVPKEYVMLGDIGTGIKEMQYPIAKILTSYCLQNPCQSVFVPGDVIYDHGVQSVNDPQFQEKFEVPYKDLTLPFYIAYGNHDYEGCKSCYLDYAGKSTKWTMPAAYYHIITDDIVFLIIDTENFNATQNSWLAAELAQYTDRLKVVIGHRPLLTFDEEYYNKTWSGEDLLLNTVCNSADLYIAGHAHVLELPGHPSGCDVLQVVSGGGGRNPRKIVKNTQEIFGYPGNGFVALTSDSTGKYQLKFINEKGENIYEYKLNYALNQ